MPTASQSAVTDRITTARMTARMTVIEMGVIALAAVALFYVRFGPTVLDPGSVDWLLARNDPGAYYLVWDFFRHDPWTFPLGHVQDYLYPLGVSLPLVDGLPLMAYPLKLVAPLLPPVFQYFGFWHLLCGVLQGFFGYLLVRRFVHGPVMRVVGAGLFLLVPTYLYREGHVALSSHWLILAAMELYLQGQEHRWRRMVGRWCLLLAVVALVHPYLLAMVLLFLAGQLFQLPRNERWPWSGRVVTAVASGATILTVWWIAGYLVGASPERAQAGGFGHFSLNLNALINPMGNSTLLPDLPLSRGQYEGYAYLGAGWLLLAALGLLALAVRPPLRRALRPHRALVWILVGTYVYALSHVVIWSSTIVLQYYKLPQFDVVTGVFRCSGRFIWPVTYAGLTGLVVVIARMRPRALATVMIGVALLVQIWDLRPLVVQADRFAAYQYEPRLRDSNWEVAAEHATALITMPPFVESVGRRADFKDFCWLASQHRIPTSSGYAARMSPTARNLADSMRTALNTGTADPRQLFVCERSLFPEALIGSGHQFANAIWDDYLVLYPREWDLEPREGYELAGRASLPEFLATHAEATIVLAVRDEASAKLGAADRSALAGTGFDVGAVQWRAAAAAIIHRGRTVWQGLQSGTRLEFAVAPGDTLGGWASRHRLELVSAGFETGNLASILIAGREEAFNARGFNAVVLGADQQVIEVAWFDTHAGEPGIVLRPVGRH